MNNVTLRRRLAIGIDLDDSLYDTCAEMHRILREDYGYNAPRDCYLTTGNTDGLLEEILESPTFMVDAQLRKEFAFLVGTLNRLNRDWKRVVKIQFITHRGYHKDGPALTEQALRRDNLQHIDVIFLNPAEHSDKMAWLLEHQPQYDHILFDDRPCHNFEQGTQSAVDSVYVMDQPWNRGAQYRSYPNRITGAVGMAVVIDRAIHNHVAKYFGVI